MNRVELIGGLTRDIELRTTPAGYPVIDLNLAVDGTRYDQQTKQSVVRTTYVVVVVWGAMALKLVDDYDLHPGDRLHVLGELAQVERETASGKKENKTRVVADVVTPTRWRIESTSSEEDPF